MCATSSFRKGRSWTENKNALEFVGSVRESCLWSSPNSRIADVYFGDVCNLIRSRAIEENYLVFVDPDTGIAESNSKPEHVSLKHLALLWSTMHSGDKLLVYQHNLREKREKWTSRKRGQLGTALHVKEVAVKNEHHADVCFFCISK
jgi:hypothetical protein